MRAQVSLTPTESKKLIGKAIANMDIVQRAFKNGTVALHPSSSTIFIVEELMGRLPDELTLHIPCRIIRQHAASPGAQAPLPARSLRSHGSGPSCKEARMKLTCLFKDLLRPTNASSHISWRIG